MPAFYWRLKVIETFQAQQKHLLRWLIYQSCKHLHLAILYNNQGDIENCIQHIIGKRFHESGKLHWVPAQTKTSAST